MVFHSLKPWRMTKPMKSAYSTLELPAGEIKKIGIRTGDFIPVATRSFNPKLSIRKRGIRGMINKFSLLIKEESGQALVLFAAMLVGLLGFTALVTDVGYMYHQKSYLQTAADSAALAGALVAPKSTDPQVETVVKDLADPNLRGEVTFNLIKTDRAKGTVEVEIKQEVPKFFSKIITSDNYSLTARAKAKFSSKWDGEALPFINLDDNYHKGATIEAWEKVAPGDFESIWKDDFEIVIPNGDVTKTYFKVFYQDGVTVTKGVVATIKQEVQDVVNQNKSLYLISLSNKVIDENKYFNIKNKDVIPYNDLVLLKVRVDEYDYNAKKLILTVEETYDIVNNIFPEDYFNADTRISSRLIE